MLAIVLMGLALIASYLISRQITKPIRALTAVANQVAAGQLQIKAPITSSDEVGTLAKTFNLITTELEHAQATLEERVQQRTQALSEANDQLKHEIAERKRYEKQAIELAFEQERRRILADFIYKASHEFKTPLSIINLNAYLVRRMLPDDKQRHISTIEQQSSYIDGLINRMVLLAGLDSDVRSSPDYLRLDTIVRDICNREQAIFKERNVTLHLDLQAADSWVCADSELFFIAVQNVLENALQSATDAVEIQVMTAVQNGTASIIIADNGCGIPPDLQARVFERFFRADESHTTRGFGLGLPIAKSIIENFGGSIILESEVGKGTTVTITLAVTEKS
jgi:signal transduction histidine kinase